MHTVNENLDGWWHAYFEEDAGKYSDPMVNEPRGGWQILDEYKESVPVPGTWQDRRPGFRGAVWYSRPFVIPGEWLQARVALNLGGIRSRARIYLDEQLIGECLHPGDCQIDLGSLRLARVYNLTIRVWHPDDTGGIAGSVSLTLNTLDI